MYARTHLPHFRTLGAQRGLPFFGWPRSPGHSVEGDARRVGVIEVERRRGTRKAARPHVARARRGAERRPERLREVGVPRLRVGRAARVGRVVARQHALREAIVPELVPLVTGRGARLGFRGSLGSQFRAQRGARTFVRVARCTHCMNVRSLATARKKAAAKACFASITARQPASVVGCVLLKYAGFPSLPKPTNKPGHVASTTTLPRAVASITVAMTRATSSTLSVPSARTCSKTAVCSLMTPTESASVLRPKSCGDEG